MPLYRPCHHGPEMGLRLASEMFPAPFPKPRHQPPPSAMKIEPAGRDRGVFEIGSWYRNPVIYSSTESVFKGMVSAANFFHPPKNATFPASSALSQLNQLRYTLYRCARVHSYFADLLVLRSHAEEVYGPSIHSRVFDVMWWERRPKYREVKEGLWSGIK